MPLWKLCSKSWCPRVPAASPFCGPRRQSLPLISCSHSSSCSEPGGGEAGFPHGDPRVPALAPLEIPWQWSGPVRACRRTQPLALEMGRLSAGPAASVHKGGPSSSCNWPSPVAVTTNHLTFQLVAQRLAWRQRGEGGSAGRKEGLLGLCVSFGSGVSLPPSLPLPLHFWQYDRPSAQDENSQVSHSHPGRSCHPEQRV